MSQKTCHDCMWWWDLYETGERKCYFRESPFFHKETNKGCENHEDLARTRMTTNLGFYKERKKEGR